MYCTFCKVEFNFVCFGEKQLKYDLKAIGYSLTKCVRETQGFWWGISIRDCFCRHMRVSWLWKLNQIGIYFSSYSKQVAPWCSQFQEVSIFLLCYLKHPSSSSLQNGCSTFSLMLALHLLRRKRKWRGTKGGACFGKWESSLKSLLSNLCHVGGLRPKELGNYSILFNLGQKLYWVGGWQMLLLYKSRFPLVRQWRWKILGN